MEMGEYDKCLAECQQALDKRYECKADFSKVAKVSTAVLFFPVPCGL